tara:strand:- start:627 stop:1364 length:738 start_codon:yes stop_codon:yes gene_type:complete
MEKISQKDIDWLLNLKSEKGIDQSIREEKVKRLSLRRKLFKIVFSSLLIIGLGIIPFFILIRTAVFLNLEKDMNGWFALLVGILTSMGLLGLYVFFLFRKVKNKKLLAQFGFGGIATLVGGFCIYALLYLSSVNAKTEDVREVYRSLHPILRVSVATTTLAEKELVITDIKRTEEDYISWGLTPLESSMHYEQKDGFVHAVDLRTIGHSEFRNKMLEWSLKAMGLQIIRHVGTADHLHVALPNKQ